MPFPTFKTKDEIPESFREEYEEREGAWMAKVEDVTALKGTLAEERRLREAAEKLSKKATDEAKKAELKAKAAEAGLSGEQLDKMRADARAEVLAELQPAIDEAKQTAAENRTLRFDDVGKKMAAQAGFLAEKLSDLWRLHSDEFDLTTDKKLIVKGKPEMDPAKYIDGLKKLRPEWVQGTQAGGGGAAGFVPTSPTGKGKIEGSPEQRMQDAFTAGLKE